ncbi:hypothetical protein ACTD5D_25905 [Nocardia takedensis]|uniref:hypothetical protein n=1 Tax=Nocardia takedensis TaxID=259390 RepID=UPI0002FEAEC1|nr:hypothetical protein [Nocardia takedensis]
MTDPVTGLTGTMTSPIRDSGALGEVLVAIRGGTESYIARAQEPIAAGTSVLIIAAHPGRIVDVVPWVPLTPGPVEDI